MKPIDRVISAIESRECGPRKCGNGWSALCPAHEDRSPSLSIGEGDDGRVLIHCHAGCSLEAVCSAVGLTTKDLFSAPASSEFNGATAKSENRRRRHVDTFATANDAAAELERKLGPQSALWTYHNIDSEPVGLIVRWDRPDGKKDIRPVSRYEDGWRIEAMPEPRPLYGLPYLKGANPVYVTEGEKAADAARKLGLMATTSSGGSQAAHKTDWRPLAGKEVIILPDNDKPGEKYVSDVVAALTVLSPTPRIKVVHLPDLPDGGDVVDFVAAHPEATTDELRAIVEGLVNETDPLIIAPPSLQVEQFVPFPTDALPEPCRGFVTAGAKAIGCDASYLALPMLVALAAAIGDTRRIQLKRGWAAPAIIWAAIVGESGTAKTPAFRLIMRPIRELQRKALERHEEEMRQYKIELARWERDLAQWKKGKDSGGDPPEKPEEPQAERFIVSDTTVEALAPLLLANPRGLLLACDELAGWIGSFDRYAGGKGGADAAHWLSMHNGESIVVDRKTGNPRTIYVPQAYVSVCGGIQPAILNRALGNEHRESGLAARLLLTCPPRIAKRWTESDIDPAAEVKIDRLMERLFELETVIDDKGRSCPVVVGLTLEAKEAWKTYYNSHAQEQADLVGDLSAAWSKLEEYAARFALVIHFARWAADDPTLASADVVNVDSMRDGITLATWFKGEARRVYAMLGESDDSRDQRRLVEWIERKGKPVTPRDVQQGCRWLRESGAAEAALESLLKARLGKWESPPTGKCGQPTRRFVRFPAPAVNGNTQNCAENSNTVDVDTVDDSQTQADDEWGVV